MEELLVSLVRYLHIATAATALVIAPCAMIANKGGDYHRLWGKIYFYAMAVVALTALVLAIYGLNLFLGVLALFSFHLVASGYRALYHKRVHEGLGWSMVGFSYGVLYTYYWDIAVPCQCCSLCSERSAVSWSGAICSASTSEASTSTNGSLHT